MIVYVRTEKVYENQLIKLLSPLRPSVFLIEICSETDKRLTNKKITELVHARVNDRGRE